jgi:hypothetical protein
MRRKFERSDALLLLPVVFLVALAVMLKRDKQPDEPFALSVQDVRYQKMPSPLSGTETLKVTVLIGQRGQAPEWWGRKTFVRLQNVQFVTPRGRRLRSKLKSLSGGFHDASQNRYEAGGYFQFPSKSIANGSTFTATVVFPDPDNQLRFIDSLRVSVPVRLLPQ